jgi:hypothetical protein
VCPTHFLENSLRIVQDCHDIGRFVMIPDPFLLNKMGSPASPSVPPSFTSGPSLTAPQASFRFPGFPETRSSPCHLYHFCFPLDGGPAPLLLPLERGSGYTYCCCRGGSAAPPRPARPPHPALLDQLQVRVLWASLSALRSLSLLVSFNRRATKCSCPRALSMVRTEFSRRAALSLLAHLVAHTRRPLLRSALALGTATQ